MVNREIALHACGSFLPCSLIDVEASRARSLSMPVYLQRPTKILVEIHDAPTVQSRLCVRAAFFRLTELILSAMAAAQKA